MNVEVLVWDPIRGYLARSNDWTRANTVPLSASEAIAMRDDLATHVDTYRGQGLAIHAVRISIRGQVHRGSAPGHRHT